MLLKEKIKRYFYIEKIESNKYIIYNIERHIPIIVTKIGLKFFYLIAKHSELSLCRNELKNDDEFEKFKSFLKDLSETQILDTSISEAFVPKPKPPKTAYLHLTNKCNLTCDYCYNKDTRNHFSDLTFDKWKQIIGEIIPTTIYFIITGGEPFLYDQLYSIIKHIKENSKECKIEILSNGIANFSKHKEIRNIFGLIDKVTFSCDNFDPDNQLRKGFIVDTFLDNMNWLILNGYSSKIGLSSVYFKNNLEGSIEVRDYCKKNCFEYRRVLVIPNNSEEINIMPSLDSFINSFSSNDSLSDSTAFFKRLNCGAGVGVISIDPEGNCFPCQNLHYQQFNCGNLLSQTYKDIIESDMLNFFRKDLLINNINTCKECEFRYICGGGCRAASYRLEGTIDAFPKTMCIYYKELSKYKLKNGSFYNSKNLLNKKGEINKIIEREFIDSFNITK